MYSLKVEFLRIHMVTKALAFTLGGDFVAFQACADQSREMFYSDVRKNVEVTAGLLPALGSLDGRPEKFYQSAGSVNAEVCNDMLMSLNKSKNRAETDFAGWLSESEERVEFSALENSGGLPSWTGREKEVEFAAIDIDQDGEVEYVYRRTGIVSNQTYQRLMIVDTPLHISPKVLEAYRSRCVTWMSSSEKCDSASDLISYLMNESPRHRLAFEWESTKQNSLSRVIGDEKSRSIIFHSGGNLAVRNVGTSTSVHWELYQLKTKVVMVSIPMSSFAPPELLVFTPEKYKAGQLQCVLMPVSWVS